MKTLFLTFLLSLFVATNVIAVQSALSGEVLAMKNQIPADTPDGESEDTDEDENSNNQKRTPQDATETPDGESEDELDDENKDKKD